MWPLLVSLAVASTPVSPKIINGANATGEEFPAAGAVLVEYSGGVALQCSSSLIAPDVVILAAHCVDPTVVGVETFDAVGWSREPDLTAFQQGTAWPDDVVMGSDWTVPSDWDIAALQMGLALNHDVGLLFLEEPILDVPLAWLPTEAEAAQIAEGSPVSIVGWGMDDAEDQASYGVEHFGDSTIDALSDYEFQVGAATDAVRKCHGDSGGPTFMKVESDASVPTRMIGVTSHTWDETDCLETGGVDTRVDYYLDWIDEQMSARCDDGTRAWCDLPGVLPPPVPHSDAELLEDLALVGCATAGSRAGLGLVLGAALLVAARRR
jgi:hypothetical protein